MLHLINDIMHLINDNVMHLMRGLNGLQCMALMLRLIMRRLASQWDRDQTCVTWQPGSRYPDFIIDTAYVQHPGILCMLSPYNNSIILSDSIIM